jgi:hypothetical protein
VGYYCFGGWRGHLWGGECQFSEEGREESPERSKRRIGLPEEAQGQWISLLG